MPSGLTVTEPLLSAQSGPVQSGPVQSSPDQSGPFKTDKVEYGEPDRTGPARTDRPYRSNLNLLLDQQELGL